MEGKTKWRKTRESESLPIEVVLPAFVDGRDCCWIPYCQVEEENGMESASFCSTSTGVEGEDFTLKS